MAARDVVLGVCTASLTAERPLRADARRNRDRLLRVAAEAFAEEGLDVGVADIARRAQVGSDPVPSLRDQGRPGRRGDRVEGLAGTIEAA